MAELYNQALSYFKPEQKRKEWYEEIEEEVCSIFPQMTYQQRIIGCVTCMVLGFFLSMGSCFRIIQLIEGEPTPFAVMYTLGNIISISSTCFLYGPWTQAKKMFASTRFITSCVYFFLMALTLFLAFYPTEIPLRLLLIVIAILLQFLALTSNVCDVVWYTLSFIPYARDIATSFLLNTCCSCLKTSNGNEYFRLGFDST